MDNHDTLTRPQRRQVNTGWYLEGCPSEKAGCARFPLQTDRILIGRAPISDVRIEARNVSKRHAELLIAGNAVFIQDLNSTNGTYVNGRRVTSATPVGERDLLQFADMEFRLGRSQASLGAQTCIADRPEEGWLISQLHDVIHNQRFSMAYQPIVAAAGMRPVAVEALVRCSVTGLETPAKLFGAAERMKQEDRVSEMCRVAAVHSLSELKESRELFLNTHPHEFLGPRMVESLTRLKEQAGGRHLVLEVHESALADLNTIREFGRALKDLGIGLAYDDFGTGQSRLLELVKAPPDYLKFDRSLLLNLRTASSTQLELLRSLVSVATQSGVQTIAEGLEDSASVAICRQLGFTHFQGYFLGRPVPPEELE